MLKKLCRKSVLSGGTKMLKRLCSVSLIFLLSLLVCNFAFADTTVDSRLWSRNLLLNSTFNLNLNNVLVDFGTATKGVGNGINGSNSLLITQTLGAAAYTRYSIVNNLQLDGTNGMDTITKYAGRKLKVSAWAKNNSNVPNVFIRLINATTGVALASQSFPISDSSWTQITKEFTVPSDVYTNNIRIYITPDTTANRATDTISYYLDNVELYDLRSVSEYGNGVLDSSCENANSYMDGTQIATIDLIQKHGGNGSVKKIPTAYGAKILLTPYPFNSGQTYKLSMWVKPTVDATKISVQARYTKSDGSLTSETFFVRTLSGMDWQRVTATLNCGGSLDMSNQTQFQVLFLNDTESYFNQPINIDDLEIRKIPSPLPASTVSQKSPSDGIQITPNTNFVYNFISEIDAATLIAGNVLLDSTSLTSNDVNLSIALNTDASSTVTLDFINPLPSDGQEHIVTLKNLYDVWGTAYPMVQTNFNVVPLNIQNYIAVQNEIMTIDLSITNESTEDLSNTFIFAAFYKDGTLKAISNFEEGAIVSSGTQNKTLTLNIPNATVADVVKLFVWRDSGNIQPISEVMPISIP